MVDRLSVEAIIDKIAELEKEDIWFHCIDLGNGIHTKKKSYGGEAVDNPRPLWEKIESHIPQDLTGMKVLDIGCNAGFFSIEAKRRNASYVLGVDASDTFLRQAEFVRDTLGLDINYKKLEVYELASLKTKFDLVLCLGVIYHCKNPLLAAESIATVCDQALIVESEIITGASNKRSLYERLQARLSGLVKQPSSSEPEQQEEPMWKFIFDGYRDPAHAQQGMDGYYNWWYPNMQGLKALFRAAGFRSGESLYQTLNRGAIMCRR